MRKIGVHYNRDKLDMLLTYELSQSMRHRRYLSVAMLSLVSGSRKLVDMLQSDVRRSDSMFVSDKVAIVLMGEMNKSGAIKAVNRYCAEFREFFDIRSSVSSFPDDGKAPGELMKVLQRRLREAMQLDRGAVVAQQRKSLIRITPMPCGHNKT